MAIEPLDRPEKKGETPKMLGIAKDGKVTGAELRDVPDQRSNLVNHILENIDVSERTFRPVYEQMKRNQFQVKNGRNQHVPKSFYTTNISNRYIQSRTSALYARDPRVEARPKDRMRYEFWDEAIESLNAAIANMQNNQQQGIQPDPADVQIVQDFQAGKERENSIKKVGRTMVLLWDYYTKETQPTFKKQLKKTIKRTLTNGVGYVKLDFQRDTGRSLEVDAKIQDHRTRIKHLEHLARQVAEGDKVHEGDKELEELRIGMKALQAQEEIIVREGLVFGFPKSDCIIPDPCCSQLNGFVGARWVAEKFFLTPDEASSIYGLDFEEAGATFFEKEQLATDPFEVETSKEDNLNREFVKIYEYYDKKDGVKYTVTPGFNDFLEDPVAPNVELEQFFPFYSFVPNEIEDDDGIYPPADIEIIAPQQNSHNSSRQGLNEHRRAARPKIALVEGALDERDINHLKNHPANAVLPIRGLAAGQRIEDILQPIPHPGVDPNLYTTTHIIDDITLSVGAAEPQLGATRTNVSATASQIAENATSITLSSHTDELDDLLGEIAQGAGQIMLKELDVETVKRIVGPGAVWPELSSTEIQQELFLDIEAGSSGKPNQAAELAKLERAMPFLIQLPDLAPLKLAKMLLDNLDSKNKLEDFVQVGAPSVVAQNAQQQPGTGDVATNPNSQGGALPPPNAPSGPAQV